MVLYPSSSRSSCISCMQQLKTECWVLCERVATTVNNIPQCAILKQSILKTQGQAKLLKIRSLNHNSFYSHHARHITLNHLSSIAVIHIENVPNPTLLSPLALPDLLLRNRLRQRCFRLRLYERTLRLRLLFLLCNL